MKYQFPKGNQINKGRIPWNKGMKGLNGVGYVPWNKGIPHTEETKRKIGLKSKGRTHKMSEAGKDKLRKFHLGKKLSPEHRDKVIKTLQRYGLQSQKGSGHPMWKGGISTNYLNKIVRKRDNYTCQSCKLYFPDIIQVDHIKPKSLFPELSKKIENLICLCPNCHMRKTNTEKMATTRKDIQFLVLPPPKEPQPNLPQ